MLLRAVDGAINVVYLPRVYTIIGAVRRMLLLQMLKVDPEWREPGRARYRTRNGRNAIRRTTRCRSTY